MDFFYHQYCAKYSSYTQIGKQNQLIYAAQKGDWLRVKELIHIGINVNITDQFGANPLRSAAQNGHLRTMELLIQSGADIHATNPHNETALFLAAQNNQVAALDLLIQKGANLNIEGQGAKTPLTIAVEKKHKEVIFRILGAMTVLPDLGPIVDEYKQEVLNHQNKLFTIFGPLCLKENQDSFSRTECARLPVELLAPTISLQFPLWYAHKIKNNLSSLNAAIGKFNFVEENYSPKMLSKI